MGKSAEDVRKEAEQNATILKRVFSGPDGDKAFDLLYKEFADRNSHVPGDPYTTAFNEGQRSVVLFLTDIRETNYE